MPSWPSSVRTSATNKATSVMGFCRPVNTLASLIGVARGRVMEESLTDLIRSIVAAPAVRACAARPLAAGIGAVLVRLTDIWLLGPYDGGCGASARPYSGPPES